MDKVKHEIEAALEWLEEGNVNRAKLHLGFALAHHGDEAVEHTLAADVCPDCKGKGIVKDGVGQLFECAHCHGSGHAAKA